MVVGRLRFGDGMRRDFGSLADLASDFANRRDQLLGGPGSGDHIGGRLVRRLHRARCPLRGKARRIGQRPGDRVQGGGAFRNGAQHGSNALAERADFGFDRHTAAFLLRQRGALSLGLDALGDVVMRPDPVLAILDWPVDHQDSTPVGRLDNPVHYGAIAHRRHDFRAIFFGIDIEASGRDAVLDQFHERAAGLHDRRRQPVHFNVTIIDDKNALVRVEQNDALRHIVEDHGQQCAVAALPSPPKRHGHHHG